MAKLMSDDALRAARKQTTEKLKPMLEVFIAIAKENSEKTKNSC